MAIPGAMARAIKFILVVLMVKDKKRNEQGNTQENVFGIDCITINLPEPFQIY